MNKQKEQPIGGNGEVPRGASQGAHSEAAPSRYVGDTVGPVVARPTRGRRRRKGLHGSTPTIFAIKTLVANALGSQLTISAVSAGKSDIERREQSRFISRADWPFGLWSLSACASAATTRPCCIRIGGSCIAVGRIHGRPNLEELKPYFLGLQAKHWSSETGNDNVGLVAEGIDGTDDLDENEGRIDVDLDVWPHPKLGVLLVYSKWGGGARQM